jgi:hypothetical protein
MIALWMAVVGTMLLAIGYAFTIPAHIRQDTDLGADQVAMQVYGYGASINDYINKTPNFIGNDPTPFCPDGDADTCLKAQPGLDPEVPANWKAYIDKPNGQPRIMLYSNDDIKPDVLAALSRHGGGSLYIGRRVSNDPQHPNYGLQNLYGQETGTNSTTYLPPLSVISNGAIVMVWRQ